MKLTRTLTAAIVACVVALSAVAMAQQPSTEERLKDELGIVRLLALYPEPGMVIDEKAPMIAVDASQLETPMDPKTVTITLDGADVSDNAEITSAYVVYEVIEPLTPGTHEVRVTAKDVSRASIEPLTWAFEIRGERRASSAPAPGEKSDNTSGRLTISTDYVTADYVPNAAQDVSTQFREKEGMKLNADLSFANVTMDRRIIGSYHRETQYYSDIELDKVQLRYSDSKIKASLGNFWLKISDLTVLGTELAGAMIEKEDGPWKGMLFSGRTQDPSTSGTFKQYTTGARGAYEWNAKHLTSLTVLSAEEKRDTVFERSATPARDEIISLRHDYVHDTHVKASLEMARNKRRVRGANATRNEAIKLTVNGKYTDLRAKIAVYSIADGFLPVAEGSAKFLKTDREGFLAGGSYDATGHVKLGGEYEQYDEFTDNETTKRGNAYVRLKANRGSSLTYRKLKLTRGGTVSETDAVNAVAILPSTSLLAQTRVTFGWQDIDYSSRLALSNTIVKMMNVNTSFKDIMQMSVSYSLSDVSDVINAVNAENKNFALGLNWNIIPFKFIWNGRYEIADNSGSNVDNEETRMKMGFKYVVDKQYTLNLGLERIDYSDALRAAYEYDQTLLRTGVEWNF